MKYYTGIGSRNTPLEVQQEMRGLAMNLASNDFTLRSGKAKGADSAFQSGVEDYNLKAPLVEDDPQLAEIYIPYTNFGVRSPWDFGLTDLSADGREWCRYIAQDIHPNWDGLGVIAKKMHMRNVLQILGKDFDSPSKFVMYYAIEDFRGNVSGGTATAVNLARELKIPTISMEKPSWVYKLNDLQIL